MRSLGVVAVVAVAAVVALSARCFACRFLVRVFVACHDKGLVWVCVRVCVRQVDNVKALVEVEVSRFKQRACACA